MNKEDTREKLFAILEDSPQILIETLTKAFYKTNLNDKYIQEFNKKMWASWIDFTIYYFARNKNEDSNKLYVEMLKYIHSTHNNILCGKDEVDIENILKQN